MGGFSSEQCFIAIVEIAIVIFLVNAWGRKK